MSAPRWVVRCSLSWRAGWESLTLAVNPYSEKMVEAMSLSAMSGQGRTFSSRFMRTVGSIATTVSAV
ncbi:MAG: hypothetical protein KIT09_34485 [Bryobacteraceae bacterium]|nr:hypothetical protein [Bryobacteraceae bacterium]